MASGVKVRYVPNRSAPRRIMNSAEVQGLLQTRARAVESAANAAGSATYASNVQEGRNRAHAIVYTPSEHAIRSNAKHNSLLKALGAGRG